MDEYAGKRGVDGLVVPGKRSGPISKDRVNDRERNTRFCYRIGCSGRLNSVNDIPYGCLGKAKPSSSGKRIIGSSSRVTSRVEGKPRVPEVIPPPGKIQRGLQPESRDADSREVQTTGVASNTRPRRNVIQRYPSASLGLATRANTSRHGLRNLRCNPISDVSSGCSSSDSRVRRREDTVKKRNSDGEGSSSSGGKNLSGSSLEGRNNSSSHGVSISATSRQTRNWRDNSASVRTRRSNSSCVRGRFSNQANGNRLTLNDYRTMTSQVPQSDITLDNPVSTETTSTRTSSYSQPDSVSESLLSIMPSSPSEVGTNHTSGNRDSFLRYNTNGIAEVLLALERIEQDEELSYEQLLVLETSLFLDGLNFYDQHRDMRLDIDNMSYEELLDLEERMGNVSTVLSEEELSKCLKKSTYEDDSVGCDGEKDDIKCSICQEEYANGDEVGRLQCEHRYHAECVKQWLQVKNWCPICKGSPHN